MSTINRCGHCKRMVGEYKTLGELIQSDNSLKHRVVVAKVRVLVCGPGWQGSWARSSVSSRRVQCVEGFVHGGMPNATLLYLQLTVGNVCTSQYVQPTDRQPSQVNADEHRSIGERFGVSGFPTIKYFPRGKAVTKDSAEA